MARVSLAILSALVALHTPTVTVAEPASKTLTPAWAVEGRWVDTCSCSIPCPCWKKELPSLGHCSEMFFFHIDKGHFGQTQLDGIELVQVASSGEGKPTSQSRKDKDYEISNLYVPKTLSADAAVAVEAIFTRLAFSGSIAKKHATKYSSP